MEIIENNSDQKAVFNIPAWLSRGTLDAIGQGTSLFLPDMNGPFSVPLAAFNVQFGTMQNNEHPLVRKYHNMMSVFFSRIFFSDCDLVRYYSQERHFRTPLCATDFYSNSFQVSSDMDTGVDYRSWIKRSA